MTTTIETYYDFRSPYAYFANYRVRKGELGFVGSVEWVGCPIFIDVILNLQAGREAWAPYVDTLIPPKRAYLMADIRRMARFYGAPLRPAWKWPSKPDQIPALCVASLLSGQVEEVFRNIIFDGMWQEQKDVADPFFLKQALIRAGGDPALLDEASDPGVHEALTKRTADAYAKGCIRNTNVHLERADLLRRGSTGSTGLERGASRGRKGKVTTCVGLNSQVRACDSAVRFTPQEQTSLAGAVL